MVVAFAEIVDDDSTLYSLADLPPGWIVCAEIVVSRGKVKGRSDCEQHDL